MSDHNHLGALCQAGEAFAQFGGGFAAHTRIHFIEHERGQRLLGTVSVLSALGTFGALAGALAPFGARIRQFHGKHESAQFAAGRRFAQRQPARPGERCEKELHGIPTMRGKLLACPHLGVETSVRHGKR